MNRDNAKCLPKLCSTPFFSPRCSTPIIREMQKKLMMCIDDNTQNEAPSPFPDATPSPRNVTPILPVISHAGGVQLLFRNSFRGNFGRFVHGCIAASDSKSTRIFQPQSLEIYKLCILARHYKLRDSADAHPLMRSVCEFLIISQICDVLLESVVFRIIFDEK